MFDMRLPGVPAADGGDRYRTAAARIKMGHFSTGINLFTGDPGLNPEIRKFDMINGQDTYILNDFGDNPDRYRAGVWYFGFGSFKIGKNSERNRHIFQNRFAHDKLRPGTPHFLVLDRKPRWYFYWGFGSGNTLW